MHTIRAGNVPFLTPARERTSLSAFFLPRYSSAIPSGGRLKSLEAASCTEDPFFKMPSHSDTWEVSNDKIADAALGAPSDRRM